MAWQRAWQAVGGTDQDVGECGKGSGTGALIDRFSAGGRHNSTHGMIVRGVIPQ
jgi:hypothetical protein